MIKIVPKVKPPKKQKAEPKVVIRAVEAPSPKKTSGWQPIETAPHDKKVLVVHRGEVLIAVYENGNWWTMIGGDPTIIMLTCWQPLPEPPEVD